MLMMLRIAPRQTDRQTDIERLCMGREGRRYQLTTNYGNSSCYRRVHVTSLTLTDLTAVVQWRRLAAVDKLDRIRVAKTDCRVSTDRPTDRRT